MTERPTGTVTFLFTDIEGSTRLWEEHPEDMKAALARHDEIVRTAIETNGGYIFATGGDGFAAAFPTADRAASAALEAQRLLTAESFGGLEIKVRIGMNTGTADERNGDYFGPVVNLTARLMGAAWGGQTLASGSTAAMLPDEHRLALGPVRLAGIEEPVEAFEIGATTASRFPPLRTLETVPNNLPRQRTSLVGREADQEQILADLATFPLVTLTGVGGVGKTRLALEVAERALPDHPGGVWLVELAAVVQSGDLIDVVVDAVAAPIRQGASKLDALTELLAGRSALLVLDNCEHLIDDVAELVDHVLATTSTTVLATSREGLAVAGERLRSVRPLPTGTDTETGPAERLFLDRLAAVAGGSAAHRDPALVGSICRRLDGVPLAIELAAARTPTMGLAEVHERLEERFRLLRGGRRAAAERHQTLRNTVQWSYELLDPGSRELFRSVSVFAGSFALDTCEAFAERLGLDIDAAAALPDLVAKSMVEAVWNDDGTTRYRLLETLRQYGAEEALAAGDLDRAREAHAAVFADLVSRLRNDIETPRDVEAADRILAEVPNLRAALLWTADADRPDIAARLTGPLGLTVVINRTLGSLAGPALRAGAGVDDQWGNGVLLLEIADSYGAADGPRAEAAAAALTAAPASEDTDRIVQRLGAGLAAFAGGDANAGLDHFRAARTLAGSAHPYFRLWSDAWLMSFSAAAGSPPQDLVDDAIATARGFGARRMRLLVLTTAAMCLEVDEPDEARKLVDEAIGIGNPPDGEQSLPFGVRGRIRFRAGELGEALPDLLTCARGLCSSGLQAEAFHFATLAAACLHEQGAPDVALVVFRGTAGLTDMQGMPLYRAVEDRATVIVGGQAADHPREPMALDRLRDLLTDIHVTHPLETRERG